MWPSRARGDRASVAGRWLSDWSWVAPFYLLVLATLSLACAPAPRLLNAPEASFPEFWERFRPAVLSGSVAALGGGVEFPLETKGRHDDAPIVPMDSTRLSAVWGDFLAQDAGMQAGPETVRQYLERIQNVPEGSLAPDGTVARVGPFLFTRAAEGWRLVRIYLDID